MESNQEQQPVRQSSNGGGNQPKPNKTLPIILSLLALGILVFIVNTMRKDDKTENMNGGVERNANSLVVINVNQQLLDQQPKEGVDYEIMPYPTDRTSSIYRDKRYGFEMKYPATWKVTTNSGEFELVQFWKLSNNKTIIATDGQVPDSAKISVSLEKDSNLNELVGNSRFDGTYGVKFVKEENLSINKMRAVRLFGSAETFGSVTTVIDRGDGVLVVISGSYGLGEKQLELQVIELSNSFRTL